MSALTAQEETHIRTALRFLHTRCGTWELASKTLGMATSSSVAKMAQGHMAPSPGMAVRIARVVKVPVDDILGGRFPERGACPHCGQPMPKPLAGADEEVPTNT